MQVKTTLKNYALLMRLDKPIGIYLLLWPTLWGLWIASQGHPKPLLLFIFVLGTIIMRSAGCIINDYADRTFDAKVKRTAKRPLTTGAVSTRAALVLFSILSLIAFMLVLTLNKLTVLLAGIGLLLAVIYPFLKRYTHLPQAMLGIAFAWGIPMAFAAQIGYVPSIAWLLFLAAVLWPISYDTIYAMVDRDDDLQVGVKSTAILFGRADKLMIGILQMLMLSLLFILGQILQFHVSFYVGLVLALGLVVYQQFLIKNRQRNACFKAFLQSHWLGFVVFVGIVVNFV